MITKISKNLTKINTIKMPMNLTEKVYFLQRNMPGNSTKTYFKN